LPVDWKLAEVTALHKMGAKMIYGVVQKTDTQIFRSWLSI